MKSMKSTILAAALVAGLGAGAPVAEAPRSSERFPQWWAPKHRAYWVAQPRCGKSAAAQKAKRIRKIARHSRVRNKGSYRG